MTDYKNIVGIIAGIFAFVSFVPYIASILKGKTKPSRTTFGIWGSVSTVTLISYVASGARTTIWTGLSYAIIQMVVFLLSLQKKYGSGEFSKVDMVCLIGAAFSVLLWIITDNPHIALFMSVAVSAFGFLPTIKKSYLNPESEDTLAWTIGAFASVLNLFALTSLRLEIALNPIHAAIGDSVVALLLLWPILRKNHKSK